MYALSFFHNSVFALFVMCFSSVCLGSSNPAAETTSPAVAVSATPLATPKDVLEINFGVFRPPYVFEKRDVGLDVEVALAIFDRMGRKVKTSHAPNLRGWKEIESGRVDGLVGVSPEKDHRDLFFSVPILFYDNVAISKAKKKIKLNRIADLKDTRFLSFEKAQRYLGPEYEEVMRQVKRDTDVSSQLSQSKLFWADKVDVIILDLNVFRHYQKQLKDEYNTTEEVVVHRIFSPKASWRCVVFRDRAVRDAFDKAFATIKADGSYQKILDKYLKTESSNFGVH